MRIPLVALFVVLGCALPLGAVTAANPCPREFVHSYGFYASNGNARALAGPEVAVADSNTQTCNVGSARVTFDGDYDTGQGGGFFGSGAWAQDPTCGYELQLHGATVVVDDVVFVYDIAFVVGEDDGGGPARIQDPITGTWICTTSGTIIPCTPATGTACDPDDCLSMVFIGTGHTCGTGGGDGGYWVILQPQSGGSPPTMGTITAY